MRNPPPRPGPDDVASFYDPYLNRIEEGNGPDGPLSRLRAQADELRALLGAVDEAGALFRYAPGKWSVKEVIAHLTDVERLMAYRLLTIARGDTTPLPGMYQDLWMEGAEHDSRSLAEHLEEFVAARGNTLALIDGLSDEAASRRGTASGHPITAGALIWILAGHVEHHMRILGERYELAV